MIIQTDRTVIRKMMQLAVNASIPVGMGRLQFRPGDYSVEDMPEVGNRADIDYFEGRMVKFHAGNEGGAWSFQDRISLDYQSWSKTYPSYQALYDAAFAALKQEE